MNYDAQGMGSGGTASTWFEGRIGREIWRELAIAYIGRFQLTPAQTFEGGTKIYSSLPFRNFVLATYTDVYMLRTLDTIINVYLYSNH